MAQAIGSVLSGNNREERVPSLTSDSFIMNDSVFFNPEGGPAVFW